MKCLIDLVGWLSSKESWLTTIRRAVITVLLLAASNAVAAARYVNVAGTNPTLPFDTWATAATYIQDAIDAAAAGDEIVVTNGIYEAGGRPAEFSLTNRVAVTKPLTVRSVNGPEVTVIRGYQVPGTTNGDGAIRCVYLTNGAALIGFTLTNGATQDASGLIVRWQSVSGRTYFIERSNDLGAHPPFQTLAPGILGQNGTTTYTDTTAVGAGPFFYRVGLVE